VIVKSDTEQALLAAIAAHPDEDDPRLRYSDWLEENAAPDRAEFIRIQIALARQGPPHKKTSYPEQANPLKALGDRHYEFTGYPEDGFAVGDRIDLLVHRALKSPKMVHGLRIYKIEEDRNIVNRGELNVYVRLDAGSGPWKGTELKKREAELLTLHRDEWLRVECRAVGPHHGDVCCDGRVQSPNAQFTQNCNVCGGTGDVGRLANRNNVYHRDDGSYTDTEYRFPVTFARGFPHAVTARLADVFNRKIDHDNPGSNIWKPTALALRWLKHHPTLRRVYLSDFTPLHHTGSLRSGYGYVGGEHGPTTPYALPDILRVVAGWNGSEPTDHSHGYSVWKTAEEVKDRVAKAAAYVVRTHLEKESERDDS